jgi:hypothetical protein
LGGEKKSGIGIGLCDDTERIYISLESVEGDEVVPKNYPLPSLFYLLNTDKLSNDFRTACIPNTVICADDTWGLWNASDPSQHGSWLTETLFCCLPGQFHEHGSSNQRNSEAKR